MEFGHYAEAAVRLVNTELRSDADLATLVSGRPWLVAHLASSDIDLLAPVQGELSAVVDDSFHGDAPAVVERINGLLAQHPLHPRISGHDETSWHLHVSEVGASVAEVLIAEALFGLTLLVTELGATRLGRCAAPGCDRAYLDTSTNRTRRFCSPRCATRTNVANYRRRHKDVAS